MVIQRDLAFPSVGRFWGVLSRVSVCGAFLVPLLVPTLADARGACVDGVDCYCDCVENGPSTGTDVGGFASAACQAKGVPIDPNLVWCEDFEDPTYENPNRDFNNWLGTYGTGTTPCTPNSNGGELESDTQGCRNILQSPANECRRSVNGGRRPNSVDGGFTGFEYNANDPDLRESGTVPGLDGSWDGCQSFAMVNKVGGSGGEPAKFSVNASKTLSFTMMKKYSANHHIGRQESIAGGNVKGDRYSPGGVSPAIVFMGGKHTIGDDSDSCTRGGTTSGFGYPLSGKFPFASLIKRTKNQNSNQLSCANSAFPDDPGPSGPMIGGVDHCPVGGNYPCDHAFYMPPRALWNPGVSGGVPMSVEGNKDGRDEWLCMQVSLSQMGSSSMSYRVSVNNTPIMRFENIKHGGGVGPISSIKWLNLWASGVGQDKPINKTGVDIYEVRDNYHVTRSATPPSCAQVGFDGLPTPPPEPPLNGLPNRPTQIKP